MLAGRVTVALSGDGAILGRSVGGQCESAIERGGKRFELVPVRMRRSELMSHLHVAIERSGDAVFAVRLPECRNGCWVNGTPVEEGTPVALKNGDILHLVNERVPIPQELTCVYQSGAPEPNHPARDVGVGEDSDDAVGRACTASAACNTDFECVLCDRALLSAVVAMPCAHPFCAWCLSTWLSTGTQGERCPKCRTPMVQVVRDAAIGAEVARRIKEAHRCS